MEREQSFVFGVSVSDYNFIGRNNIARLKSALVGKDLVEMVGKRFYITDPVFALWFRIRMF